MNRVGDEDLSADHREDPSIREADSTLSGPERRIGDLYSLFVWRSKRAWRSHTPG